jgi:hypothetical protein
MRSRTNRQQLEHGIAKFDKRRDLHERIYLVLRFPRDAGKRDATGRRRRVALMGSAEIADNVVDADVGDRQDEVAGAARVTAASTAALPESPTAVGSRSTELAVAFRIPEATETEGRTDSKR